MIPVMRMAGVATVLVAVNVHAAGPVTPAEADAKVAQKHLYDKREIAELEKLSPFAVVQRLDFDPLQALLPDGRDPNPFLKVPVQPLVDEPLRDPSICVGPDPAGGGAGVTYYLTGTSGPDFQNNDGIRLWKSQDCVRWEDVGLVWDITDPENTKWPGRAHNRWTRFSNLNPECPERGMVRGVTSPEIHYLEGTYWLVFSMNESGCGLLKSTTGKAEGPYENVIAGELAKKAGEDGRISTRGGTPSLFQDDDGAVYFVYGGGWIAKMKEDLTGLAEKPRLLAVAPDSSLGDYPLQVGKRGAFIFKAGGKYNLCAEDVNPRLGFNPCHDTFVAVADNIYGPYSRRDIMLTHAGQTTVFKDAKGRLFATYCGQPDDRYALCKDRPAIVPVLWDGFLGHTRRRFWTVTEAGPVGRLKPVIDVTAGEILRLRDPLVTLEPDGWYYVAGTTGKDKDGMPGARVWRSRDLKYWERIQRPGSDDGFIWSCREAEWTAHPMKMGTQIPVPNQHDLWGPQLFAHNGTYWIPFMMFCRGTTGILKSTTGKPEGPYECTAFRWKDGAPHLFKDDDGSVYLHFCFGPPRIGKLKPDMSGFEVPPRDINYARNYRQGFEGTWLIKQFGKYILFQSDRPGMDKLQAHAKGIKEYQMYNTYDWFYSTADNIMGPYSAPRPVVPHGGTGSVFKDKQGVWQAAVFCSDPTSPYRCNLGFVPLDVRREGGDVRVKMIEWPIEEAAQ